MGVPVGVGNPSGKRASALWAEQACRAAWAARSQSPRPLKGESSAGELTQVEAGNTQI